MEPKRFADRNVLPSSEVVDAALRAFWRGSAGPIDRLAGGNCDGRSGLGESLLLLVDFAGRARSAKTRDVVLEDVQ